MSGIFNNWGKNKKRAINTGIPDDVKKKMANATANANAFFDTVPDGYHSFTTGYQPSSFTNNVTPIYTTNNFVGPIKEPSIVSNEDYYSSDGQIPIGIKTNQVNDIPDINISPNFNTVTNTVGTFDNQNIFNPSYVKKNIEVGPPPTPEVDLSFLNDDGFQDKYNKSVDKIAQENTNKSDITSTSPKFNGFSWGNEGTGQMVGGIASAAGTIGDAFLQQSFSNNQNTALSGAFSFGNEKVDEINGVNKSLNATDFGNLQGQYNNQNSILNGYKTKTLSKGQIGGMAGVGAAKGAAAGSAFGPYGAAIGAVVGAGAGLGKGLLANKKIKETNDAAAFAQQGLNNSYLATAQNIRNLNANNKKADMYYNQNFAAYGGNLYANGGLMNPYGINVFNTGGTHEQNKYGGVPVSIAEDGKPNLVEKGEVLFNDYVYSDRININNIIRRRLNLKDSTKTFADAAKEVKERGDDRPNDPVTEKTIKAQMQFLKSEQDKKKEQQEEREQQKMIAQMNEQQLQAMQEKQMNEEADAYKQQMAEEQMAQQAPQEQQMVDQQMQEQMMAQQQPQQQMFANGGNLKGGSDDADAHRFAGEDRWKDYDWSNFDFSKIFNDDTYQYINKRNNKAFDFGANKADEETKKAYDLVFNNDNEYTDDYNNLISSLKNMSDDNKAKFLEGYKNLWKKYHGTDFTGDFSEAMTKLEDKKWGNAHAAMSKILKQKTPKQDEPTTEKTYKGGEDVLPNYDWRYKQTPVPGLVDTYLAARAFEPADYSRANSIINTPIRDIQYTPNGGYIAPYIIDPRLQYQMNADLGAATNRGLVNNAGGNSAAAQATLLANNRQISQSAANLGYQADEKNAAQIQGATQYNSGINRADAQGFISAAEANQRADVQRGEFNYYGQNMKENIDAQRGQAISNSLQSLSDDYMNYYKDRYNQGMMAGLVDSGYFGEPTPFLRQQTGWNPNGTFTKNNYLIDDNGNKHYIVNNADGTVAFANPNDDLISKNQGKKLVFNNGEYKFVG